MPNSKPWFLRSKKLGDYSHLQRKDFNELREVISEQIKQRDIAISDWKNIRTAALIALADLAAKHHCKFEFNVEGGHICIYKNREPVFALRIGSHSRHRVEALLRGKALYRAIVNIVPSIPVTIPGSAASDERAHLRYRRLVQPITEPVKVLYSLLPTAVAGKWKNKEAHDMVDVIECVKAHPSFSRSDIQHTLNFSPRKTIRLLDLLQRRRILHRRGSYKSSGWYLNRD